MNKLFYKKRSGSAILIALFIMTTLGVVAFGSSRLYISELKTTTNITGTTGAYFASEAALEKGLLAYRENPDVIWNKNCNQLDTCSVDTDNTLAILPKLANGSTPKVRVNYLGQSIDHGGIVKQDESRQITIKSGAQATKLSWTWKTGSRPTNGGVRITYIDPTTGEADAGKTPTDILPSQDSVNLAAPTAAGQSIIIRFRPLGGDLADYSLSLVNPSTTPSVDTGQTLVDGVGTYSGVSRQLEAKIDRSNGQLLGIFDYTLFGINSIK